MTRERGAGPDVCQAIARALGLPPEEVFRQAGLLPTAHGDEAQLLQRLKDILVNLPPIEQDEVLAYAYWRYQRAQRKPQAPG